MVQHLECPHARPQRWAQWWPIVGELGSSVHQDVIGGSDDVGGVNPHNGCCQIALAAAPALHSHWLILRPKETPPVPEETLLRVPVSTHLQLKGEGECWSQC